jgi:hypothetical protein
MSVPPPNYQHAAQDFAGQALWAVLNAGRAPRPSTLAGMVAGPLVWQNFGKQRIQDWKVKVKSGEIETALTEALEGNLAGFSEIAADVEDNEALALLGRPLTYLAALYATGYAYGQPRTLPEYLVIASAGAGTGSFLRSNFLNPSALNAFGS